MAYDELDAWNPKRGSNETQQSYERHNSHLRAARPHTPQHAMLYRSTLLLVSPPAAAARAGALLDSSPPSRCSRPHSLRTAMLSYGAPWYRYEPNHKAELLWHDMPTGTFTSRRTICRCVPFLSSLLVAEHLCVYVGASPAYLKFRP